jgi:hypothetical protein
LARKSPDAAIAADATQAHRNLRPSLAPIRITAWFFPIYSSRWQDLFGYAQVKAEIRTGSMLVPYATVRFVGDTRVSLGTEGFSESTFVLGVGVHTVPWRGVTGWCEAGSAISYTKGHMLPDYRGGVNLARAAHRENWFADSTIDLVFISRFGNDVLAYSQSRIGYKLRGAQLYWNGNLTVDVLGQPWANTGETGPGVRLNRGPSAYLTANLLQGMYLQSSHVTFHDFRLGLWYAFTY